MRVWSSPNRILGICFIVLALVIAVLWIPFDVGSGITAKARRQIHIGDAMLPALACLFVFIGALMVAIRANSLPQISPSRRDILFLFHILAIIALSFAIMRWLGEFTVWGLLEETNYRTLRDTVPWKYLGFLVGGTILVSGLISLVEGRVTTKSIVMGLLTSIALVVVYDLPFDDLLLPPNGDV